jgi:hypothetical protein
MNEPTSWGDASRPRPTDKWQPPAAAPAKKPMGRGTAIFSVVLFFALFGACGVALATAGSHSSSSTSATAKEMTAFDMCKQSVRSKLKAPTTAKFRDYFGDQAPSISGTGDGPYTVVSTVDSQNGFGAMIRSSFVCTAEYIGNDQWHASSTLG